MNIPAISPTLKREVEPIGRLLNDNDVGVDNLGYSIFAEALSKLLHRVQTPLTVGVFAPWGTGKSFLLREVRSLLLKYQHQTETDKATKTKVRPSKRRRYSEGNTLTQERRRQNVSCAASTILLLIFVAVLVSVLCVALIPDAQRAVYDIFNQSNSTTGNTSLPSTPKPTAPHATATVGFFAVIILLSTVGFVFLAFACCVSSTDSKCWEKWTKNFRLVSYAAYTKLPTLKEKSKSSRYDHKDIVIDFDEDAELTLMDPTGNLHPNDQGTRLQTKYIFVNFNAWEYAGSDTLWAGIVTNLTDAIEAEFGVTTARLFRMFDVEEICDDSTSREPCTVRMRISDKVATSSSIKELMMQYGVVVDCKRTEGHVWEIQYSNSIEAKNAFQSLKILGLLPVMSCNTCQADQNKTGNNIKTNASVDIEMDNLVDNDDISTDYRQTLGSNSDSSFCSHFLKHPKNVCCGCPFLYMNIIFVMATVLFPIGICVLVSHLHLDIVRSTRAIPIEVQVLAWMPATLAVLLVIAKFCYAMFQSQTRRINQALVGVKGNMAAELGFMDKVKDEIKIIEKLVRCLRFTHRVSYKIIISIDDLDRCQHDKVKSVLEAVNILLSDRSSPFVCLIALDSRIAVKCIEEDMGSALLKANVNGHEYIKKIINLPFCLPELGSRDKRRYFAGLMDQADRTKLTQQIPEQPSQSVKKKTKNVSGADVLKVQVTRNDSQLKAPDTKSNNAQSNGDESESENDVSCRDHSVVDGTNDEGDEDNVTDDIGMNKAKEVSEKDFLFLCRKFLHDDETLKYHIFGNPRNMKRIFNVVSMTTQLMRSLEEHRKRAIRIRSLTPCNSSVEQSDGYDVIAYRLSLGRNAIDAKDIVRWIVLTDQWPYRASYLLQVIEDADQRSNAGRRSEEIDDGMMLFDIYQKIVIPELNRNLNLNESTLLSLDGDPDLFLGFLQRFPINKQRAVQLKSITINLDQSLRQNIALYRSLVDLQKKPKTDLEYVN